MLVVTAATVLNLRVGSPPLPDNRKSMFIETAELGVRYLFT
jgi:hypothetical protein